MGGGDNIYENFFSKNYPLPGDRGIISTSNISWHPNIKQGYGILSLLKSY